MLEVGEQPAVRRPERDVAAVDRGQVELVLVLPPGLDPELDQPAGLQVVAHEVLGQVAPAQPGAEPRVLGVQIAHAPSPR